MGTKISYVLLALYIAGVTIHNVFFATSSSSAVLTISFVFLMLFLFSLVMNIFTHLRVGKPKDIWKLGWIGLLGFLGMIPGVGIEFVGLYGFYGFFGLKKVTPKLGKK